MRSYIEQWIEEFVSVHNEALNSVPCPYAKAALIKYHETEDVGQSLSNTLNNWSDDAHVVVIYTATSNYTPEELKTIVKDFNSISMREDLVALEDHPDDEEIINGVKMNFGKCILVLVQRLSVINRKSEWLRAEGYYDNWPEENLDDVVNWRFNSRFVK